MDTVSLPQLPATVLVTIAKLVAPADLVSLCDSHPQLAFLRLYLPDVLTVQGFLPATLTLLIKVGLYFYFNLYFL